MADIKFMDISENDTPSTNDSILISNNTDGVKRTKLANVGQLFAINKLFHVEWVTGQTNPDATDKLDNYVDIAAPVVPGYQFAFWLTPVTLGNTLPLNLVQATSVTTGIYVYYAPGEDKKAMGPVKIGVTAVYVKNELA